MEQKSQKSTLQEDTLRYKMLQLLKTNTKTNILPLAGVQIVLEGLLYVQLLKFSIDYLTPFWLGTYQPLFAFLDLSHYFRYASPEAHNIILFVCLAYMNLYWIVHMLIFLSGRKLTNLSLNFKRLYFLLTKNLLFLPLLNSVFSLFRSITDPFNFVHSAPNTALKFGSVISVLIFLLLVIGQTFHNFQFLKREGLDRCRRSALVPTLILLFFVINEALAMTVESSTMFLLLGAQSGLLLVLFLLKNQHLNEPMKLVQLSYLSVNVLSYLVVGAAMIFSQPFTLELFGLLACFVTAAVSKTNTYSLQFQIQNINKWPTSQIMIRYNSTLRSYLRRRDEYMFNVSIQGYMEMHRHKCDIETCPSRTPFTEHELKMFENGELKEEDEQLLRCENIIKKIYSFGYKESPVSNELQLENSIFLYEKGEKEVALKTLLQVQFQALDKEKYYQYHILKEKIHQEMCEEPDVKFLDLVSELRVKYQEEEIIEKMETATLTNIQFWTTLNEDHPDFQKLHQLAYARIQARQDIQASYSLISSIASSEKVTSLYVQYLQAIENDEAMFNTILEEVKEDYELQDKIVLKDWTNTSHAIMVVSIEEQNYGTILDINSSCAMLLGYEKYQMLYHSIKTLFPDQLGDYIKLFLSKNHIEETYLMAHKSGYLVRASCRSQNYNSMNTGMATVITLTTHLTPDTCYLAVAKDSSRFLGVSSSTIALLGLEQKTFDDGLQVDNFFLFSMEGLISKAEDKTKVYTPQDLIQPKYQQDVPEFQSRTMRLRYLQFMNCRAISLEWTRERQRGAVEIRDGPGFEFQVQATLSSFKFFGCYSGHETYLSQFSQLSYAQSLKQGPTIRNFSLGIKTLRLKENIIQVIEENQQEDVDGFMQNNGEALSEAEEIAQREQAEIFQSRSTFTSFIEGYSFGYFLNFVMIVGKLLIFALFVFSFITMSGHNRELTVESGEMVYNSLMAGTVAKELSLVYSVQQMKAGQSYQQLDNYKQIYKDNLAYGTQIRFLGGEQYNVSVFLGVATVSFLNHQFLLSFLDNANIVGNALAAAQTKTDFIGALGEQQQTALNYLMINANLTKDQMIGHSSNVEKDLSQKLGHFHRTEVLLLIGGLCLVTFITVLKLIAVCRINRENMRVFEIFLDITDVQIQTFTSKSQKFLTSLHSQDVNGEIDVDEEVENTRKISSSTFTKKKRFKNIEVINSYLLRFLFLAAVYSGYFIHSFVINSNYIKFATNATQYFFLTSQAEHKLYSGLAEIQKAALTGQPLPTSLSTEYLTYYKNYFQYHYVTYGQLNDFHQMFTSQLMLDICNGMDTAYGSTNISLSCQLPELSPNGSYLVFTDMVMQTEALKDASSLTDAYMLDYQVVAQAHRKLSQNLLVAQVQKEKEVKGHLVVALIVWILLLLGIGVFFIILTMKDFVQRLSKMKNILTVLPISIARNLPKLTQYCSSIMGSRRCC